MLYIYLPVLCYHGNLYVTEGAYPGGRGFPLSSGQRSFLFLCNLRCNCKYRKALRMSMGKESLSVK